MTDIQHLMGFDLTIGSTGDVAVSVDDEAVRERVLRRLLTAQGAYIWQLSYGGGLAGFVGQVANASLIQTVVRSQMLLEAAVATQPLPTVSLSVLDSGIVTATVTYTSATSGTVQQPSTALGG